MEKKFNFENFQELLESKETLLSESESDEFFEEISVKLEKETNIFGEFNEIYIWNRITEMLIHIPADTLIGLKTAKIVELIKCDISKFQIMCHHFANNLVETNEYYDVNPNNTDYFMLSQDDDEDEILFDDNEDEIERQEHLVHSFIERDDYDKDSYSALAEF